jgi:hypothetical protein
MDERIVTKAHNFENMLTINKTIDNDPDVHSH